MFKLLKEKVSGWFKKKDEEKSEEKDEGDKKTDGASKDESKRIEDEITGKEKKSGDFLDKKIEEKEKEVKELKSKKKFLEEKSEIVQSSSEKRQISNDLEKITELEGRLKKVRQETEKIRKSEKEESVEKKISEENFANRETPSEELKEEFVEKGSIGFFARLKKKLSSSVLKKEDFDEMFVDFELSLMENNVALEVIDKIREDLSRDLVGIDVKKGEEEKAILESLKNAISEVLNERANIFSEIEKSIEPYIVLFFGINGAGKTTSIAKFAYHLKKKGISCVLGAGDTFRAASIEQLEEHAKKIGVPIIKSEYGKDPAAVAFDAIQYARKNKLGAVLIDTAGRMYTQGNLMREMEKIVHVSKPNLKIFVGESITGNDATEQARRFNDSVGIDGIILSKADIDEKAGAILSVGFVTGKPILFLGTGQKYDDLKEFRKEDVLKGLGLD